MDTEGVEVTHEMPVTVKGDFDNDGTEETLSRSDFYIFENGWAIRAYSYTVINDKGNDVVTLQNRSGHLFAAAASPYTITGENISVFLKEYTISLDGTELKLQSDNHRLLFVETKTIDRDLVKNAPLEPENNGDLASKTWRMKYETGFEAKPGIFYPVEKTGDFDKDGTDETIKRDDYYVFDIPWCYTAFVSTIVNDKGPDTLSLQNSNGILQIKHINYFVFNEARDTIHLNGNAYAYSNNGENIMLNSLMI